VFGGFSIEENGHLKFNSLTLNCNLTDGIHNYMKEMSPYEMIFLESAIRIAGNADIPNLEIEHS
jgi:hypothetical protein